MDAELEAEMREIGLAIAGMELALWAAMRSILAASPEAAETFRQVYPALLSGVSGADANAAKQRAESNIRRWLGEGS